VVVTLERRGTAKRFSQHVNPHMHPPLICHNSHP
jgi:hypothetical protein